MLKLFAAAALAGLMFAVTASAQEDVPPIRKTANKEDKKFQEQVFLAIVKAARSKPREPMFEKGTVKAVNKGRTEMILRGNYKTIRGPAEVTINLQIDSSDEKAWEVLRIDYKDTNKASPAGPNLKNIDKLRAKFNR